MAYKIAPRENPINDVAAADLWGEEDGKCKGVLIVCDSGIKKIREGGLYPDDICKYGSLEEIREQDSKLMEYSED